MNRVVVTGLGMITPLGRNVSEIFEKLCLSEIGIKDIDGPGFEGFEDLPVRVAGLLNGDLNKKSSQWLSVEAAKDALRDSGLGHDLDKECVGVVFGTDQSSFNYLQGVKRTVDERKEIDCEFMSDYSVSKCVREICKEIRPTGFCSVVTAGFATGQASIIQAYKAIKYQKASIMLAGSSEDAINPSILMSLYKSGYLSREGEITSCKPFDIARDGFIYSNGSCCLVLESLQSALSRKAQIYCEILGTTFITSSNKENLQFAPRECMKNLINKAGIQSKQIQVVNCDAAGYKQFDEWEAKGVEELFEDCLVTSHKGNLGHMISASGSCQSAITCLILRNGKIPPVMNLIVPSVENVNYVCRDAAVGQYEYAISNNYSYDPGLFTSILFKKFKD